MGYFTLRKHFRVKWTYSAVLVLVLVVILAPVVTGKCLDTQEVYPKRYLHFQDKLLNITIEASDRVSHQLTSHVFKIYAQEVLGYENITIHRENEELVEEVLTRLSGSPDEEMTPPETMINLEVWVPPDFDVSIVSKYVVKACGYLRSPGRFGWYIPKQLARPITTFDSRWSAESGEIYWSIFRDDDLVSNFSISDGDLQMVVNFSMNNKSGKYYCNEKPCIKGTFTPKICEPSFSRSCGLLLAPSYYESKFLISHIQDLKLRMKVIWLGPNLKTVVNKLTSRYSKNANRSLVFLGRKPSDLVYPEHEFVRVGFKECEALSYSHGSGNCHYEMVRMEKFAWGKLETYAKHAYRSLRNFEFSDTEFNALLNLHYSNQTKSYEDIACDWLRTNTASWKGKWQIGAHEKNALYIGGIFPLRGSITNGHGMVRAAVMAKDAINRNMSILPDYDLKLIIADGECRADKVMKTFIDYVVNNEHYDTLIGVVGPGCSDTVEPLAGVSKYYKTMVISYSAEGANFSDREKYPYFFRTIAPNAEYIYVYLELMKKFGWKRISAITEDGQKYTEYISHMKVLLENSGMSLVENIKFPRERENTAMTQYLQDLKKVNAKIVIADVEDNIARHIMCEAYNMEMSVKHGYVWFLPVWLNQNWYNTTQFPQENVNCSTSVMIEAINGYLSVTHQFFASDHEIMEEGKAVGQWRKEYLHEAPNFSDYAGYAYDAVWVYAEAMDKLIRDHPEAMGNLHSENTTNKLVELVEETSFHGVSGRIDFRNGPSRYSIIQIEQWYYDDVRIVGTFYPNVSNYTSTIGGVLSPDLRIKWPTGVLPDDGTPISTCALDSIAKLLNVQCDTAIIIVNFVGILLFASIVAFAFFKMRNRYEQERKYNDEYMKSIGINLRDKCRLFDEKWELHRKRVVVTRKLGDGAFGIVYGGEAMLNDGWIPVAVKTLKEGSSAEDTIDFLREAEAMKGFEHENIVKLLGVCTEGQPLFTVMELMLYGDLKTYLLARRSLVEKAIESDEVSSKRLTSMALDVARGLSYLAELKYIHRDIACRNCLVNISKVVKIADFGMTRQVHENDFYRFSRKGLLPVRWMAPESLSQGLFSLSTDVWSYGVLLYELVTFGGFPYSSMHNSEVLEYVLQGKTLDMPKRIKPQLEALMKSCWKWDSEDRPAAKEIVEYLAEHNNLVTPSLAGPQCSVEHGGDSDVALPRNFITRKPSTVNDSSLETALHLQTTNPASPQEISSDDYSVKEPLIGALKKNSTKILNRYVKIARKPFDVELGPQEEDDYVVKDSPNNNVTTVV